MPQSAWVLQLLPGACLAGSGEEPTGAAAASAHAPAWQVWPVSLQCSCIRDVQWWGLCAAASAPLLPSFCCCWMAASRLAGGSSARKRQQLLASNRNSSCSASMCCLLLLHLLCLSCIRCSCRPARHQSHLWCYRVAGQGWLQGTEGITAYELTMVILYMSLLPAGTS